MSKGFLSKTGTEEICEYKDEMSGSIYNLAPYGRYSKQVTGILFPSCSPYMKLNIRITFGLFIYNKRNFIIRGFCSQLHEAVLSFETESEDMLFLCKEMLLLMSQWTNLDTTSFYSCSIIKENVKESS